MKSSLRLQRAVRARGARPRVGGGGAGDLLSASTSMKATVLAPQAMSAAPIAARAIPLTAGWLGGSICTTHLKQPGIESKSPSARLTAFAVASPGLVDVRVAAIQTVSPRLTKPRT